MDPRSSFAEGQQQCLRKTPTNNLNQMEMQETAKGSAYSPCLEKSIYLHFEDISYSVRANILSRERRKLLNNVCGDFRPGQLAAIMGPSGAGKSTLMDILAGFTTTSISGSVTINGKERNLAEFRRSSAYIMQDDNLQPLLTVEEAMRVAADLKLTLSHREKLRRIEEILTAIGLDSSCRTRTDELSGGQRKRLSIALELLNNPPVMFLDEPTSGLDSVTSRQCIELLKQLARQGRTVICTIHQPSAMLFNIIDHLYVIAEGKCVYTGSTCNVVPYLSSLDLHCPVHYNPADFLMEICNDEYGKHTPTLVRAIENGRSSDWKTGSNLYVSKAKEAMTLELTSSLKALQQLARPMRVPSIETEYTHTTYYATGFWRQLCILLKRNAIRLSRDRVLTFTRLSMHFIIAMLVGTLYFRVGQEASYVLDNVNLLFFSIMFLMFSAFSAAIITFPVELPVIMREHFNRWYKLRSFYLANKIADFPVQLAATSIYTLIVYYMSDQLPDARRLLLYILMCVIICLVAQAVGLIVGIVMKIQNGMIFGPFTILPFVVFSGFFVRLNDAHPYLHWLFHVSFLKYGFEGVMVAIYGYDRPKLRCSADYCHFGIPEKLLLAVDMKQANYWYSLCVLLGLYVFLDVIAYTILWIRLKKRI